jgi:hypothetical protein
MRLPSWSSLPGEDAREVVGRAEPQQDVADAGKAVEEARRSRLWHVIGHRAELIGTLQDVARLLGGCGCVRGENGRTWERVWI